jgi:ppGpp synthetase/RelA/SpoT-type nucleotidyltranferase
MFARMLREFENHAPALHALAPRLEGELRRLLEQKGVVVQFVSSRVKTPQSLRQKLARPEKTYRSLWQVTDLVGLRIATYFEDTIDEVAALIEGNYEVDFSHSIDKLRITDAGRFGYRSLHYVCALPESGLNPAFRFEIQVRTALQHAWAEVEHDLGYKVDSVPAPLRRRFSRVASLLEIADQEFVSLRRELEGYRQAISQQLADAQRQVPIDVLSLDALTRTPAVRAVDEQLARTLRRPLAEDAFFPEYLVRLLAGVGLDTSARLQAALARNAGEIADFVPRYFECSARHLDFPAKRVEAVQRGYGLFFLGLLDVLRGDGLALGKVARLTQLYMHLDELDEAQAHTVASALVSSMA